MHAEHNRIRRWGVVTLLPWFGLAACAGAPAVKDYRTFYDEAPFTVVVPPVVNRTADVDAPRFFTATMTKPLVDRGYYVIPVEATAAVLRSEGVVDGEMLLATNPRKFRDYFGADAVLFVTLKAWDTSYFVLASSVTVSLDYRLVSTRTGAVLWETQSTQTIRESANASSPLTLAISLLQVAVTAAATDYVPLAMQANHMSCATLPSGPYAADFAQQKAQLLKDAKAKK